MNLWEDKTWKPMLLKEKEEPFNDKDYLFEMKYDGMRAILYVSPTNIVIKSRNNKDVTNLFPELKNLCKYVDKNVIFDGEIIMMDKGHISFPLLQKRIHLKNEKTIKYLCKTNPITFIAFDILYEDKELINKSLIDRLKILNKYPDNDYFIKSKVIYKEGISLYKYIKEINEEGIVAKKIDSKYEINRRSDNWIKIKNYHIDEFKIVGYKENKNTLSIYLVNKNNKSVGSVVISKKLKISKELLSKKCEKINDMYYLKKKVKCFIKYRSINKIGTLREPFIV